MFSGLFASISQSSFGFEGLSALFIPISVGVVMFLCEWQGKYIAANCSLESDFFSLESLNETALSNTWELKSEMNMKEK